MKTILKELIQLLCINEIEKIDILVDEARDAEEFSKHEDVIELIEEILEKEKLEDDITRQTLIEFLILYLDNITEVEVVEVYDKSRNLQYVGKLSFSIKEELNNIVNEVIKNE